MHKQRLSFTKTAFELCLLMKYCMKCTFVSAGDKEMTAWLLENYPEVGDTPNTNGDLAVHFAAAQGKYTYTYCIIPHS